MTPDSTAFRCSPAMAKSSSLHRHGTGRSQGNSTSLSPIVFHRTELRARKCALQISCPSCPFENEQISEWPFQFCHWNPGKIRIELPIQTFGGETRITQIASSIGEPKIMNDLVVQRPKLPRARRRTARNTRGPSVMTSIFFLSRVQEYCRQWR